DEEPRFARNAPQGDTNVPLAWNRVQTGHARYTPNLSRFAQLRHLGRRVARLRPFHHPRSSHVRPIPWVWVCRLASVARWVAEVAEAAYGGAACPSITGKPQCRRQ